MKAPVAVDATISSPPVAQGRVKSWFRQMGVVTFTDTPLVSCVAPTAVTYGDAAGYAGKHFWDVLHT